MHYHSPLEQRRQRGQAAGVLADGQVRQSLYGKVVASLCVAWLCAAWPVESRAQGSYADDALILPAKRVRLSTGIGWAMMGQRIYRTSGMGLNLEQAVGLGTQFEFGARYAVRFNRGGRGLRADEFARVSDTEKFGTGSSVIANPELRLTLRVIASDEFELAVDHRTVLPLPSEPDLSLLFGLRLRKHVPQILRVDLAGYVAPLWQKYYEDRALGFALAAPGWIWVEPFSALFFGATAELRHTFSTRYTESQTRLTLGAVIGSRFGASDLMLGLYFTDVMIEPALRIGSERFSAFVPGVYNDAARRIGFGLVYSVVL